MERFIDGHDDCGLLRGIADRVIGRLIELLQNSDFDRGVGEWFVYEFNSNYGPVVAGLGELSRQDAESV